MNTSVNNWLDEHKQELLDDIKELCSIPSVKGKAEPGKPFGEGPYRSLNKALEMLEGYGFKAHNMDNYVGYADFDENLPKSLDILGHTDVVPAGEGWTVTEPFNIIEKDGRLYGRGTSDDKGPLLCAVYALRAIKETGVPVKKGIRVIVGADEETGSSDIVKYYEKFPEGEMTFSPDAEFPVINIEKGQFRATLSKDFAKSEALPRLVSLNAGVAVNAVPQKAVLRFAGLEQADAEQAMKETAAECGVEISFTAEDEVTIVGESAHASTPELGKNAGLAAVIFVNKLGLPKTEATEMLSKIPTLFPYGVTDGSGMGIKMSDEESGQLTCTLDMYHVDEDSMSFIFDARTPVMANKENCEDAAEKTAKEAGFDWLSAGMISPHVVPGNGKFVSTLLKAYEDVTGLQGECIAIGGGTYVHELKNGVAFGAILPGVDTHMHGADEFMDIDGIMTAAKVYAEAIIALCC